MTTLEQALLAALLGAIVVLAIAALRGRASREDLTRALQTSPELAVVRTQLDNLTQTQAAMQQGLGALQDAVRVLETRLVETGSGIKDDLGRPLREAQRVIDEIRAVQESRSARDEELRQAIARIEAVVAGYGRRGEAGEQIIAAALKEFPAGMVEHGFRVNGKEVEFALVLPNGRRLPVDSKWAAAELLRKLAEKAPGPDYEELADEIERNLERRVREVKQYVSPPETLPWAIAAVPDAAYAVARRVHAQAYREGVLVIPYSLTVPYLLTVFQLYLQHAAAVDMERLAEALTQLERHLGDFDRTLENSVAKAVTMLQNAYAELKALGSDIRGVVRGLRTPPVPAGAKEE